MSAALMSDPRPAAPRPAPSAHVLRTLAIVAPGSRVLDLGCGTGRHALAFAQLGFDVWACDADAAHVGSTREALSHVIDGAEQRVTQASPDALGYPDDHFDWVVAYGPYDSAETVGDLFGRIAETKRVLKMGAWVIAALSLKVASEEDLDPEALAKAMSEAGLALAEDPALEHDAALGPVVRGIFRKVGPGVSG